MKMKNQKMTTKRYIIIFLLFTAIIIASNLLARNTNVCNFSLFETTNLFTYFGVLIGFALTIYTFGISMVDSIKQKVDNHTVLNNQQKTEIYERLVNGFGQIKGDIWFIFYSIILVIIFSVLKEIVNPFGWNVENLKIPETANLTLFVTSTIAMCDIMQTLFNLSEINFELNR